MTRIRWLILLKFNVIFLGNSVMVQSSSGTVNLFDNLHISSNKGLICCLHGSTAYQFS